MAELIAAGTLTVLEHTARSYPRVAPSIVTESNVCHRVRSERRKERGSIYPNPVARLSMMIGDDYQQLATSNLFIRLLATR